MAVSLQDILVSRENRAKKQQALLQKYQKPLICFTMNIAGPEKCSERIRWGFALGNRWLDIQFADLPILHREEMILPTGCEAYYVVDAPAMELKRRTVQIEDSTPVARLFDMDVLTPDGSKLDRSALGLSQRKCLLCDQPAHVCSRSRAHSVEALQDKTDTLLWDETVQQDSTHIGQLAQKSLLFEVCTTPKPGLVDCRNSGSHPDMDIFSFLSSSAALGQYFMHCSEIGIRNRHRKPQEILPLLRFPGKVAEQAMYQATGGVNTHKGCIFSLGILCAAAGRLEPAQRQPDTILAQCKEMTAGLIQQELAGISPESAVTAGERIFAQHGITGVRGQAESGFPSVLQIGLPVLEAGLAKGLSLNDAGCAALLALMAVSADTNLIRRGGMEQYEEISDKLKRWLQNDPYPSTDQILALDDIFIARNLSPGGSADLLAITYFLHFLKNTHREVLI